MKISKEERALLSEIIQRQFMQTCSANHAEKTRLSSKREAKPCGFLAPPGVLEVARNRKEE